MRCEDVAEALPRVLEGTRRADRRVIAHVETCLACQAELARYRRMLRLLSQLRTQRPAVPPGAVSSVLVAIEERAQRQAVRSVLTGRRLALYAVATVAVLATVAATTVLALGHARRDRPSRAASGGPLSAGS